MTSSESLVAVLCRRDGIDLASAEKLVAEARERVLEGEDPEEILMEEFGLEPDFVFDLLSFN